MMWLVEVGIQRRTDGQDHLDFAVVDDDGVDVAAAEDLSSLLLISSAIFGIELDPRRFIQFG